jgi:hypothetical protein
MKAAHNEFREPPLEVRDIEVTDPETGHVTKGVEEKRGILRRQQFQFDGTNAAVFKGINPAEHMEEVRNKLRDFLEAGGLPSDRMPRWIRDRGGEWRPVEEADDLAGVKIGSAYSSWYSRATVLSGPLSAGELAADLLFRINNFLRRPAASDCTYDVLVIMTLFRDFTIATGLAPIIESGVLARRIRAAGPKALKQRSEEAGAIVARLAQDHWARHPLAPRDASNTSLAIADAVNAELADRNLLPASRPGLKTKTISDYIRRNF